MAELQFKDFNFKEEKERIRVNFLKIFYFYIEKKELKKISEFSVRKNSIEFKGASEKKASRKFSFLLEKGFHELKNKITKRKTIYIHKNSGIALIGSIYFGIIDRGTNIIEIRPITGCNINCIYCSVDEGIPSKKQIDYVIEKDYMVSELKKLIKFKDSKEIDIHINSQGEPLLYADITELIKDIKKIKEVKIISVDTNGTLLTKELIDNLAKAGLTRINLSLNALSQKTAEIIANKPYNLKKVKEMAEYATKKTDLIIAPVLIPGYNEKEIPKLIEFSKKIEAGKNCPPIGIQNFYSYKSGRNPAKEMPMDEFFKLLKELEKKHNIELIVKSGFKIIESKELPKPFRKKQTISAELKVPGRLKNEMLAVSKERVITIPNCAKKKGIIKTRITRIKHNIFYGEFIN